MKILGDQSSVVAILLKYEWCYTISQVWVAAEWQQVHIIKQPFSPQWISMQAGDMKLCSRHSHRNFPTLSLRQFQAQLLNNVYIFDIFKHFFNITSRWASRGMHTLYPNVLLPESWVQSIIMIVDKKFRMHRRMERGSGSNLVITFLANGFQNCAIK